MTFMSFSPDSVRHLLRSVPAQYICQLVDDINLMKATQLEGERILDSRVAGLAGPGIDYVRGHPATIKRWLASGRRFRVWTVDSPEDVALCQELGIHELTTNVPARVLGHLQLASPQGR